MLPRSADAYKLIHTIHHLKKQNKTNICADSSLPYCQINEWHRSALSQKLTFCSLWDLRSSSRYGIIPFASEMKQEMALWSSGSRRRPLKAESRVRFSLGSPRKKTVPYGAVFFIFIFCSNPTWHITEKRNRSYVSCERRNGSCVLFSRYGLFG